MERVLKKYDPCPVEWMNAKNPRFTLCEVIREIYHITDDAKIKMLCRIATNMAKSMNHKLMEYNTKWQEQWDGKTDELKSQIGG